MADREFKGDKKAPMRSPLAKVERRLIDHYVPKFPRWIEGYHLTLMTIPLSVGLVLFGYLAGASDNLHWLWLSSLMLFLQWFTDSFDGSLGRYRDTGIPKWGFYMDHLLDYVFMTAVLVGYVFIVEAMASRYILFGLAFVYGLFMLNSFLSYGATGDFKITYLGMGPTEMRLVFILINTFLILFRPQWAEAALPYVLIVSIIVLCVVVFRTQKYIWSVDMADKAGREE